MHFYKTTITFINVGFSAVLSGFEWVAQNIFYVIF